MWSQENKTDTRWESSSLIRHGHSIQDNALRKMHMVSVRIRLRWCCPITRHSTIYKKSNLHKWREETIKSDLLLFKHLLYLIIIGLLQILCCISRILSNSLELSFPLTQSSLSYPHWNLWRTGSNNQYRFIYRPLVTQPHQANDILAPASVFETKDWTYGGIHHRFHYRIRCFIPFIFSIWPQFLQTSF